MSSVPQTSFQQRSLYRRHRPRSFDDVVGQESVVRTLRNAVELDRVHHAYLFVGSRGTGKTSIAKILAACLNCERGRSSSPCGVCESCVAIAEARSLDVIEMDAASHNSVEDIRELRDSVAFQPLSGRSKVYILDEAHMLSNAAWNAFLKTLEEPPGDTVFVMATTEAQKVPATVIDRCHRFDFQRPTVEQVATVIARAAEAESIEIPREAVAALAKSSSGSFRDALGALEQIVTYGGQSVKLDDVLSVLGIADSELVEAILDAVATGDAKAAMLAIERCVDSGRDVSGLTAELEARARELILVRILGKVPRELALTPDRDLRLLTQAQRIDEAVLTRLMDLLGFATQVSKAGGDARTQLELALLKAAKPEVDPSTKALLARIERLETARGRGVAGEAKGETTGTRNEVTEAEVEPAQGKGGAAETRNEAAQARNEAAQARNEAAEARNEAPKAKQAAVKSDGNAAGAGDDAPEPEPAESEAVTAQAGVGAGADASADESEDEAEPKRPMGSASQEASDRPAQSVSGVEGMREMWPAVVGLVREGNALLGAVIAETAPFLLVEGELTIVFPSSSSFNKRKAESPANKALLSEAIATLTGERVRLAYELLDTELDGEGEAGGTSDGPGEDIVHKIIAEFDAEELPQGWSPERAETQEGQ